MEQISNQIEYEDEDELHSQLIPLKGNDDKRSVEIRAMSHVKSPNRSIANSIAKLKKLSAEQLEKKSLELLNKNLSAQNLARLASELTNLELSPKLKIMLFDKMIKFHTSIHIGDAKADTLSTFQETLRLWREQNHDVISLEAENARLKDKLRELGAL